MDLNDIDEQAPLLCMYTPVFTFSSVFQTQAHSGEHYCFPCLDFHIPCIPALIMAPLSAFYLAKWLHFVSFPSTVYIKAKAVLFHIGAHMGAHPPSQSIPQSSLTPPSSTITRYSNKNQAHFSFSLINTTILLLHYYTHQIAPLSSFSSHASVVAALSWYFGILVNKICKIMKIFTQIDYLRNRWVLCQC